MALVNVRLDEEDARRVAELRRAGIQISGVVRQAIRDAHARRVGERAGGRAAMALLARIYADHPDTPGVRRRGFDLRDRQAVRAAVQKRARGKRA
jgi:Arc/MetJ-type ribon-helix-helix transcriptional regulator